MSLFDALAESISTIFKVAKDLPTENIAAAGLLLLSSATIALNKIQDMLGRFRTIGNI